NSRAAYDSLSNFALWAEHHQVGWRALLHLAMIVKTRYPRGVYRSQAKCLLQIPMGVLHHIAESTIHSEDASREFSVNERSSVLHFYFAGAETIAPFGHSGRSRCIGNQHRSIGSLGFQKELHHSGVDVNTIGNNVGRNSRISQHFGQNPRIAMREGAHRIKGVSRMPRAGCYCRAGGIKIGVGMPEADAHTAPRRLSDHLGRSGQFWSDRHNANVTTSRLPETSKRLNGRRQQVLSWMHAATRMTNKGSFEMDSQRDGTKLVHGILLRRFDGRRQSL